MKITAVFILLFIISCIPKENTHIMVPSDFCCSKIQALSDEKIEVINKTCYYFGHQSVGNNIIDGIKMIIEKEPRLKVNIKLPEEKNTEDTAFLLHSKIGKNEYPISKIEGFEQILDEGVANEVEFAIFKFCYIDFNKGDNVDEIFSYYKNTISRIESKHPNLKIVHVTVPLRHIKKGPKAFAKRIVGKSTGFEDNQVRMAFNEKLLAEYENTHRIFDLAGIESTYPDGARSEIRQGRESVFSLVPEYTYDGGHLTENAKLHIAQEFLLFLADLK